MEEENIIIMENLQMKEYIFITLKKISFQNFQCLIMKIIFLDIVILLILMKMVFFF
jgi:hypothetical protein